MFIAPNRFARSQRRRRVTQAAALTAAGLYAVLGGRLASPLRLR